MQVDMSLYLQNIQAALLNEQYQHALFLLDYAIKLAGDQPCPLDVAVGLHRGQIRKENEDCIFALSGVLRETHPFGLYVVCDGMGGHAHGRAAAQLAIQTIVEYIYPSLVDDRAPSNWEFLLAEGVRLANQAIYQRNQVMRQLPAMPAREVTTAQMKMMGTTVTVALILDTMVYVANVGDSRAYLYTSEAGLTRITRDHSIVAELLANRTLKNEEEVYTHPQRNQITRALGTGASVEVDTFVFSLPATAILLLCSDGLWEMTRDRRIEEILASPWDNASSMSNQLMRLAHHGGGTDNIGCIVVQTQPRIDTSVLKTIILGPARVSPRLAASS